jgi:hypothetical protein
VAQVKVYRILTVTELLAQKGHKFSKLCGTHEEIEVKVKRIGAKTSQSQSHVTTDDQSVSKSWIRAPCGSRDRILISV